MTKKPALLKKLVADLSNLDSVQINLRYSADQIIFLDFWPVAIVEQNDDLLSLRFLSETDPDFLLSIMKLQSQRIEILSPSRSAAVPDFLINMVVLEDKIELVQAMINYTCPDLVEIAKND